MVKKKIESAQENNETDITPDVPMKNKKYSKDELKNLTEYFLVFVLLLF